MQPMQHVVERLRIGKSSFLLISRKRMGSYDGFVPWLIKYKEACEDYINADSAKLSCVIFCFSLVALIFSPIFV